MLRGVELVEPGANFRGGKRRVRQRIDAGELQRLALVGRDQIEPVKRQLSFGLRIERDEFAGGAGQLRHAGHELVAKNAFRVVGKNDGVTHANFSREQRLDFRSGKLVRGHRRLAIEPAELLMLHEHAGLENRRRLARRGDRRDFFAVQDRGETRAGIVAPDEPGHGALCAQRGDVERDVGSAARGPGIATDVHHGDGRLRGNARGVAPDVVVEHDIPDHEDAQARDRFEQCGETFHESSQS
jgi:hypothetical protein